MHRLAGHLPRQTRAPRPGPVTLTRTQRPLRAINDEARLPGHDVSALSYTTTTSMTLTSLPSCARRPGPGQAVSPHSEAVSPHSEKDPTQRPGGQSPKLLVVGFPGRSVGPLPEMITRFGQPMMDPATSGISSAPRAWAWVLNAEETRWPA